MKFNDFAVESAPVRYTHEELLNRLALESSLYVNVADFFKESLPSVGERLKALVSKFSFTDIVPQVYSWIPSFAPQVRNKLENEYLIYRDVLVQVPEGFKGEFLPYIEELISVASELNEHTNKLLSEYRFVLSSIITNKEQRTSLKDLSENYERTATAREQLSKRLAAYFSNDTVGRARLITVLPRFADAQELLRKSKDLSKFVDQKSLKEMQRSIREITEILELLEKQLKKEEITNISPAVVKNIAIGAHELAQYIDAVVAFHYASISIITCVNMLIDKLKELGK